MDDDAGPLQTFVREFDQPPSLTQDEEIALTHHILARDAQSESAGRMLVEANVAVVVSIARRYQDGTVPLLDLIKVGNEGLLRALQTIAAHPTERFSTHAAASIEDVIRKAIAQARPPRG